jgi:hypothetical protein
VNAQYAELIMAMIINSAGRSSKFCEATVIVTNDRKNIIAPTAACPRIIKSIPPIPLFLMVSFAAATSDSEAERSDSLFLWHVA